MRVLIKMYISMKSLRDLATLFGQNSCIYKPCKETVTLKQLRRKAYKVMQWPACYVKERKAFQRFLVLLSKFSSRDRPLHPDRTIAGELRAAVWLPFLMAGRGSDNGDVSAAHKAMAQLTKNVVDTIINMAGL